MFKPGSLQRDYTLISQYDECFDLPVVPAVTDDSTDEEKAEAQEIASKRSHLLKTARETGDYKSILRPGSKPVQFICRQIPGTLLDWWHDQDGGEMQRQTLLLRLAIKSIKGLPDDIEIRFETSDGHRKLSEETLDWLYSVGTDDDPQLGRKIVGELAGLVAERTFRGLVPLSKGG